MCGPSRAVRFTQGRAPVPVFGTGVFCCLWRLGVCVLVFSVVCLRLLLGVCFVAEKQIILGTWIVRNNLGYGTARDNYPH